MYSNSKIEGITHFRVEDLVDMMKKEPSLSRSGDFLVRSWARIPVYCEDGDGMYLSHSYPAEIDGVEIHFTHLKMSQATLEEFAYN